MPFRPYFRKKRAFQGSPGRPWESSVGVLAMAFSPCLSRKRSSHRRGARLRWASYRARRITRGRPKRTLFLDRHAENRKFDPSLRVCDGLFSLPVDEKPIMCACDGLFPLPVDEKAVMGAPAALRLAGSLARRPREAPGGPPKCPGSSRGQNMQFLLTNVVLKW